MKVLTALVFAVVFLFYCWVAVFAEECSPDLRTQRQYTSNGGLRKWVHDGRKSQCRPDEPFNDAVATLDSSNGVCWLNRAGKCTFGGSGEFNATASTRTSPCKSGTTAPATCGVGECFYDTDAAAGSNLYFCTSTNTWTLEGGGGGGGGAAPSEPFITKTATSGLSNEFALGSLATGVLKNTNGTGVPTIWDPSPCVVSGSFVLDVNSDGTLVCATLAFSQITGTVTDAQVPDSITVTLAATATALAANGANCPANQAAGGVSAAGAVESCIAPLLASQLDTFPEFVTQVGITGTANGTTVLRGDGTLGNAPTADVANNLGSQYVGSFGNGKGTTASCVPTIGAICTIDTASTEADFLLGGDLSASTVPGRVSRGTATAVGGYIDDNGLFRYFASGTTAGAAASLDPNLIYGHITFQSVSVADQPGLNRLQVRHNASGTPAASNPSAGVGTWVETSATATEADDVYEVYAGLTRSNFGYVPGASIDIPTNAPATCTSAIDGAKYYSANAHKPCYCDGSQAKWCYAATDVCNTSARCDTTTTTTAPATTTTSTTTSTTTTTGVGTTTTTLIACIGNQNIEASTQSTSSNRTKTWKFTASATGTLRRLWIYANNSGATQKFHGVFYANGAGCSGLTSCPTTLLGDSIEVTIAAGTAAGWQGPFTFSSPPAITNTTVYWIGHLADGPSSDQAQWRVATGATPDRITVDDTYSDGAANPYGSGNPSVLAGETASIYGECGP